MTTKDLCHRNQVLEESTVALAVTLAYLAAMVVLEVVLALD